MKIFKTLLLCTPLALASNGFSQLTTETFNFTGAVDTFVYSACMGELTLDVIAGSGGDAYTTVAGGDGGRVQATWTPNDGDTLFIYVGDEGISNTIDDAGGFGLGGDVYSYSVCGQAGTGGGASDIRLNGNTLADRVIVAGGGGGAGGTSGTMCPGGDGGDLTGATGVNWPGWPDGGGKGGTPTAGGGQGVACCSCPTYTTDGALGDGGNGSGDCAGGGGGGGGYYGGGGACFSGGGGGSSYTDAAMTGVVHTQGHNDGDGMIIITYTLSAETTSSPSFTECDSMVSPSGLYVWTVTGSYMDTIPNALGCDSVMTIDLTIETVDNGISSVSAVELTADMAGATYQWINCADSSAIAGETSQTFTASSNGDYAVIVTNGGCTDTSACMTISEVGIGEINPLDGLRVSPNPFNNQLSIQFSKYINEGVIEVRDLSGKIVYQTPVTSQNMILDLNVERGTYFVSVMSENDRRVMKVIKK